MFQNAFSRFINLFWLGIAYILIVQVVGEWYPFTHYPMYSSFPNKADYYYIADGNGKFFASYPTFGAVNSDIKDMMQNRFSAHQSSPDDMEAQREAGKEVLDELWGRMDASVKTDTVKLHLVKIHVERQQIVYEPYILATKTR